MRERESGQKRVCVCYTECEGRQELKHDFITPKLKKTCAVKKHAPCALSLDDFFLFSQTHAQTSRGTSFSSTPAWAGGGAAPVSAWAGGGASSGPGRTYSAGPDSNSVATCHL